MKKAIIIILAACLAALISIALYIMVMCAAYGKYIHKGPDWAMRATALIFMVIGIDGVLFLIYKKQLWLPEIKKLLK